MIEPLTIWVPGEIRGKGRPRFARRGAFTRVFTDEATMNMENWVKACAVKAFSGPVLDEALEVLVTVFVAIPRSWSKKKQQAASDQQIFPTGKPDCDNFVKLLFDALNGLVWRDDSIIVDCSFRKVYASPATRRDASPGAVIIVQSKSVAPIGY